MFTNPGITYQATLARHHDLMIQAERRSLARQARKSAPTPPAAETSPRRTRRAWRLALRPLAQ